MTFQSHAAPAFFACLPAQEVVDHVGPGIDARLLLSSSEAGRAARFTQHSDRLDFVAARLLARLLLAKRFGYGAGTEALSRITFSQQCERCGAAHGRPVVDVPGEGVSWSHAGGYVAAVVGAGSVGVDLEPLTARGDRGPRGTPDLSAWVRAEAIIKSGHGTLDEAMAWLPGLGGPGSTRGRRYLLGRDGRPRRHRGFLTGARHVVVTDAPPGAGMVVCSAATQTRAVWVDPRA